MRDSTIGINERNGSVSVCAQVTSPPGGLGAPVTVQLQLDTIATGEIIAGMLWQLYIYIYYSLISLYTSDPREITIAAGMTMECTVYTFPTRLRNQIYESSPVLEFTVLLFIARINPSRITMESAATQVTVNDDDSKLKQ